MNNIAISVKDVSKKYRLYDSPKHRMKEALNVFGKKYHHDFWALRDISFDLHKGETFGILGRNGCGKSTLLQIICGILLQSSGEVVTNGRISALLELGTGFNPEYTGRSNVYMNGAIMGFSRKNIDKQIESIEEFADIGEFIDQPMKTYSSGMYVRLAFACAINIKPEILVVDEALSVGDVFFQQKCFRAIRELITLGTTCLFVSHDTTAIMNICNRAILLENGEIDFQGAPEEVVSRYYSKIGKRVLSPPVKSVEVKTDSENKDSKLISSSEILEHNILKSDGKRIGEGGLELAAACVRDSDDNDILQVEMMGALSFYLMLRANEDISKPTAGIQLYDRLGNLVFAAGTQQLKYDLPPLQMGDELIVRFDLNFNVQPGEYTFELILGEPSSEGPNIGFVHDRHLMLGPIIVASDTSQTFPFYGIAQLPMVVHSHRISNRGNK